MVRGDNPQLRWHPSLIHNINWFNIKATAVHHPVMQKEVDELLVLGATEPLTGCTGFYLNVFAVPKCTDGLLSILSLK